MAGAFLSLRRVLPNRYPLEQDVESYIAGEQRLGRMLDYAVIVPRLQRLYEWSAEDLGEPRLRELVRDGNPRSAAFTIAATSPGSAAARRSSSDFWETFSGARPWTSSSFGRERLTRPDEIHSWSVDRPLPRGYATECNASSRLELADLSLIHALSRLEVESMRRFQSPGREVQRSLGTPRNPSVYSKELYSVRPHVTPCQNTE